MSVLLTCSKVCLVSLAAIFILFGAACFLFVPALINHEIISQDYLGRDANGTYNALLQKFIKPPYSIRLEVWTFSVTNANDVVRNGSRPHVVEKGPYTFVETQDKNASFKSFTNDTHLYYQNYRHYFYNQSLSCDDCQLSDNVTVPSLVFQKIVDFMKGRSASIRMIVDAILRRENESAYTTVEVGDLLFNGYTDPLIRSVCGHERIFPICKRFGVPERIGIFYRQNNTNDGLYEIDTGVSDVTRLGRVYAWNGMLGRLNNSYWFGDGARMINGTDSQLYPPYQLLKHTNLQIFAGQACRFYHPPDLKMFQTVEMEYREASDVRGVPVNRYVPSKSMNDVKLQRQMGFYAPDTPTFFNDTSVQEDGCLPSGLMDMSGCVPGAPRVYVSDAHFLGAPDALRAVVVGVTPPDADNDGVYVDIEPLTGVLIAAQRRSQINVGVLRGNLGIVANMRNAIIVPMVWMNESVIFDDATRAQLLKIVAIMRYVNVAAVTAVLIGVALFVGFFLLLFLTRRQTRFVIISGGPHYQNVDTNFFDDETSRAMPAGGIDNANYEHSSPAPQLRSAGASSPTRSAATISQPPQAQPNQPTSNA